MTYLNKPVVLILILIFGSVLFMGYVQPAKGQPQYAEIHISADGSVTGTDKIQRNGNVYTFTDNINGAIAVDKDKVVIDGANHTLSGPSKSQHGISLLYRNGVTIKNVQVNGFGVGIWLAYSSNNTIYRNVATIQVIFGSQYNVITQNYVTSNASNSYFGISAYGTYNQNSNNIITNNLIANNPDGIDLYECTNFTVTGNTIVNSSNYGLNLQYCSLNTFTRNNIINNTIQVAGINSGNNTWDMNYWSDHVDDGPYLIQYGAVLMGGINYTDVDYHPAQSPNPSSTPTPTPTSSPTPTPSPSSPTTPEPKSYSTTWVLAGIVIIVVISGLIFYLRKRKHQGKSSAF